MRGSIPLTVNMVLVVLGVLFGGLAVAIVIYGRSRVRQAPKTTPKPAAAATTKPPISTAKAKPSEKFCEKCYAVISDDLEFCSECGARQT